MTRLSSLNNVLFRQENSQNTTSAKRKNPGGRQYFLKSHIKVVSFLFTLAGCLPGDYKF